MLRRARRELDDRREDEAANDSRQQPQVNTGAPAATFAVNLGGTQDKTYTLHDDPHEGVVVDAPPKSHVKRVEALDATLAPEFAAPSPAPVAEDERARSAPSRRTSLTSANKSKSRRPSLSGGVRSPKSSYNASDEWRAEDWVASLAPVAKAVSAALLVDGADAPSQLEHVRELGRRGISAADVRGKLERAGLIEKLSEALATAIVQLTGRRAATARELHDKYCQDESSIKMTYGGLNVFHRGLEGAVGPPHSELDGGMLREHCRARDSQTAFTASNYGTTTTSEMEYHFVTEPFALGSFEVVEAGGQREHQVEFEGWPDEEKLRDVDEDTLEASWRRQARTMESFAQEMQRRNDILAEESMPPLQSIEFIAARLYTGPLYCKYNAVLRGFPDYASRKAHVLFTDLCQGNTYATTLHVINSAISKLSKLTPAAKCYRGVVGVLPTEFWEPNAHNVRGGVEPSFLSTTLDQDVALEYARHSDASNVFEVQMGMIDRGADLSWLSQYPHEREMLFAPLCGLEVQRSRVDECCILIEAKLSVNLRQGTIEEVLSKMRTSHVNLLNMLLDEMRVAGAPARALAPLDDVKMEAISEEPFWFNNPEHYMEATAKALDAQKRAFRLLGEPSIWEDHTPASSTASTPPAGGEKQNGKGSAPSSPAGSRRNSVVASLSEAAGMAMSAREEATEATEEAEEAAAHGRQPLPRGRVLWFKARNLVGQFMKDREKATSMFNSAKLCAQSGHDKTAVKLLQLSMKKWPLREESPWARIVRAAMHAAGADDTHRWRLEATMLTDGMVQPWPRTLVELVCAAEEPKVLEAFSTLCETLDESSRPFGVGARVLAWHTSNWVPATVTHERTSGVRDVRLDSGEHLAEVDKTSVLAVAEDGPGAVMRSAAEGGAAELVQSLLLRRISPFICDRNAETPLHRAARHGQAAVCKLLVAQGADSFKAASHGASAYLTALLHGQMHVVRLFEPYPSDLDTTAFAKSASPLLQASARGDQAEVVEVLEAAERVGMDTDNDDAVFDVVNESFVNFVSPLMVASRNGHPEVVEVLVQAQADLLARSKRGVTALHMAVESAAQGNDGAMRCVEILLRADRRRTEEEMQLLTPRCFSRSVSFNSSGPSDGQRSPSTASRQSSVLRRASSVGTPSAETSKPSTLRRASTIAVSSHDGPKAGPTLLRRASSIGIPGSGLSGGSGTPGAQPAAAGSPPLGGSPPLNATPSLDEQLEKRPSLDEQLEDEEGELSPTLDKRLSLENQGALDECRSSTCSSASMGGRLSGQRGSVMMSGRPTPLVRQSSSLNSNLNRDKRAQNRNSQQRNQQRHAAAAGGMMGVERVIDVLTEAGNSPLHVACRDAAAGFGRGRELVSILLAAHANVNLASRVTGLTPLMNACRCGEAEVVKILLEHKADAAAAIGAEVPEAASRTAMEATCVFRRLECLKTLIEYQKAHCTAAELTAFINQQSIKGRTALMRAAMSCSVDCADILLHHKAEPDLMDTFGKSALLYACDIRRKTARAQNQRLVSLLVQNDSNVDLVNELTHEAPLMVAAGNGHAKCVRVLMDAGASIEYESKGETALMRAARTTDERCLAMLLSAGAKWGRIDAEQRTVMHIAARHGNDKALLALLARVEIAKALVNQRQAGDERTPLMVAAEHGWWRSVRTLLSCSEAIDLEAKDAEGYTAMDLAELNSHFLCAQEIERYACEMGYAAFGERLSNGPSTGPGGMRRQNLLMGGDAENGVRE